MCATFKFKLVLQANALLAVLHERVVGLDAFLYVPLDSSLPLFPVLLKLLLKLADPRETGNSLRRQCGLMFQAVKSEGDLRESLLEGALEVQCLEGRETCERHCRVEERLQGMCTSLVEQGRR